MKRCIWLPLLALSFVSLSNISPVHAAGLIIVDEAHWLPRPPWPPEPVPPWPRPVRPIPHPHVFAPMEVSSVHVHTRINDQVARTEIDQEFYNPNAARLEGTFVFPVPKGAHLDKFTMEIDGKQMEAELVSADKGRHIYEDIVRRAKDPALLEYAGRDLFKVRIFPIEPNSKKRITLSYTQLLKSDAGLVSYLLPLNTEKFSAKPIHNVSVKVDLETKRPLKSIYSPSHSVEIKRRGSDSATVGYEASDVQPDNDFALYFAPEKDELGVNLLADRASGEDGYFLLLASPGVDIKEKQLVLKDVAFVLDTSGSMAGKKLDQAKKALQFCVENLNDGDRFEILRFSTEVEPLFNKLTEANRENRSKADDFIKDLKAIGATAIDDALRKALELRPGYSHDDDSSTEVHHSREHSGRPFVIIFLTDGCPTIGVTSEDEIVANAKNRGHGQTRVFCFGIGNDVNTHLLDRISEDTHAFSQYVLPDEDLEVKLSNFYSKIKDPVLANPKIEFTGGIHVSKLYPSPLPDLFKGEQLVLVGRYSGKGSSAVLIEGDVNGERKKFTYEVKFTEDSSENEFIPRLWATRRVGYLLDEIRLHGENSELRDEATELARKYGIVTPYTAYLIVEDESRRNIPNAVRSLQSLNDDSEARREAAMNWHGFKQERVGDAAALSSRYGLTLKSAEAPAPALANSAVQAQNALRAASPSASALSSRSQSQVAGGSYETEAFSKRYGVAGGVHAQMANSADSKVRLLEYSQQSRFVAGKSFFLNGKEWIDSDIQKKPNAKRVRIIFGSPEYFDLTAKNPNVLSWLALGQDLQFVLDGVIYEIHSTDKP